MSDIATQMATDLAAIRDHIPEMVKTMVWKGQSISIRISPIVKSGALELPGIYPDYEFSGVAVLSDFADPTDLPNHSDSIVIDGTEYFIVDRIVWPVGVSMRFTRRNNG